MAEMPKVDGMGRCYESQTHQSVGSGNALKRGSYCDR